MRESEFLKQFEEKLKQKYEGIVIYKIKDKRSDPDRLLLFEDKWAALDGKREKGAHQQPNQRYKLDILNKMSYGAFVSPENEQEVLDDLERLFRPKV